MKQPFVLALAIGLSLFGTGFGADAVAADAPPARLRGTIDQVAADSLTITTRDHKHVTVQLPATVGIGRVDRAEITDIQPGSYIGTAAAQQPDGTLRALEVHVFDPSLRGSGEGHRPWDMGANSTMTNGTVGDLVVSNGRTMTVRYGNGEQKQIVVPDDVPIVRTAPGDRSLLVAGAHVIVNGAAVTNGVMTATRISVGANGIVPPM